MASFDYRLNPLYRIKECSSCGALYTTDYCCSEGSLGDKIICDLDKTSDLSQRPPQNCPNPPQINHHCCYECGDPLEDIFCHQCTCELCGRGAHYGYNCSSKVLVVPYPEPFNNQTVDDLPQTLLSFDPTCYSEDGNSFTYDSTSNLVHDSPNVFSPPLQPPIYLYEFCRNDAYYGHDYSLQVPGPHETCQCDQLIFDEHYCKNYGGPHMNFQCQPMNQNHYEPNPCYDSNSFGFDQFQPLQFPVIYQPIREKTYAELLAKEQEASINTQSFQYFVDKHCQPEDILELFQRLQNEVQNTHEELAVYINTPNWDRPTICYYDDDDEDYAIAVTPSLSTKDPDNSLSMGDDHLDTILAMKSDDFIKSSVENLVPIPSEYEGIPDNMCDMPFHDNYPPLNVSKDQFEDFSNSNDESTSTDDDSFSIDNIEYVEASPPNSELVGLEVMEIVIPKSSSASVNSILEETNTFDNSLPEFEIFCFDLEEISSGSTTTHSDSSFYDSFIFDLSINQFPPANKSDFYEFVDELTHIISPLEYDCFSSRMNPTRGILLWMWWRIFFQQKNQEFILLCPPIPPFN
nr:hypothetical protein [Tanacetum cinerariifolium]